MLCSVGNSSPVGLPAGTFCAYITAKAAVGRCTILYPLKAKSSQQVPRSLGYGVQNPAQNAQSRTKFWLVTLTEIPQHLLSLYRVIYPLHICTGVRCSSQWKAMLAIGNRHLQSCRWKRVAQLLFLVTALLRAGCWPVIDLLGWLHHMPWQIAFLCRKPSLPLSWSEPLVRSL